MVEAKPGKRSVSDKIAEIRNGLVAEHIGGEATDIATAIEQHGSLRGAIEALTTGTARRLLPVEMRELTASEEMMAESDIADPERPSGVHYQTSSFLHQYLPFRKRHSRQ
jgi:hypothetical protein